VEIVVSHLEPTALKGSWELHGELCGA